MEDILKHQDEVIKLLKEKIKKNCRRNKEYSEEYTDKLLKIDISSFSRDLMRGKKFLKDEFVLNFCKNYFEYKKRGVNPFEYMDRKVHDYTIRHYTGVTNALYIYRGCMLFNCQSMEDYLSKFLVGFRWRSFA